MKQQNLTYWFLFALYLMMYSIIGILPASMAAILKALPFSSSTGLGIMLALNLFIGILTMLVLGYYGERIFRYIPRKILFTATNLLWIVSNSLLAFVPNFYGMLALVNMGAVGVGAFIPVGFSMISDMSSAEQRGIRFGGMHLALVLGNGCGMLLGSLLSSLSASAGWRLAYAITGELTLIPLLGFLLFGSVPGTSGDKGSLHGYKFDPKRALVILNQKSVLGILGTVLGSWIAMSTLASWSILYLTSTIGSPSGATMIYLFAGLGAMPGAVIGGRLGDRLLVAGKVRGRIQVSLTGTLLGVSCFFLFYAIPAAVFFGFLGYFFSAFAIGNQFALYTELVPTSYRSSINALTGIMMNGGGMIGNLLISSLIRGDAIFLREIIFLALGIWASSCLFWILPLNYFIYERLVPSRHEVLIIPTQSIETK